MSAATRVAPRLESAGVHARRGILVAMATVVVIYGVALASLPARFMTTDAAKYVGIGRNVLDGRGPLTVFDIFFPFHSPTWPLIVMTPEALLGLDWASWARTLSLLGGLSVLAILGAIGWRIAPAVGLIALALFAAFGYQFQLARTLGLDEAAAATTLGFVVVALLAVERRPTAWGIVAGLMFAFAFLIKESVLPFAPLPIVAALVGGRDLRIVLRLVGTFAMTAFVGTLWWFLVFASYTGRVYRLETPAWTLIPIALGVVVLFVAGRLVGREEERPTAVGHRERFFGVPAPVAGWALTVAWAVLLTGFSAWSRYRIGEAFLDVGLVRSYARSWGPELAGVLLVAAAGTSVVLVARLRGALDRRTARRVDELLIAAIMGATLVPLVVSFGELPRHYIPQLGLFAVLGATGWWVALDRLRDRLGPRLQRSHGGVTGAALAAATLVGVLGVGVEATKDRSSETAADGVKSEVVRTVGDWIRGNLPGDGTIVLGSLLGYEIGTAVQGEVRVRSLREFQAVLPDPDAPLGVGQHGLPAAHDWVALEGDPHDTTSFYGYRGSVVIDALRAHEADIWVEGGIVDAGDQVPILAAATEATGLVEAASWAWEYPGGREMHVGVFRVARADLGWPGRHVYLTRDALRRLVSALGRADPNVAATTAAALVERMVVVGGGDPTDLLGRLEALATP